MTFGVNDGAVIEVAFASETNRKHVIKIAPTNNRKTTNVAYSSTSFICGLPSLGIELMFSRQS